MLTNVIFQLGKVETDLGRSYTNDHLRLGLGRYQGISSQAPPSRCTRATIHGRQTASSVPLIVSHAGFSFLPFMSIQDGILVVLKLLHLFPPCFPEKRVSESPRHALLVEYLNRPWSHLDCQRCCWPLLPLQTTHGLAPFEPIKSQPVSCYSAAVPHPPPLPARHFVGERPASNMRF